MMGRQKFTLPETRKALVDAILAMPRPMRDVFLLKRVLALSNAEIANQLGIEIHRVEKMLGEALVRLVRADRQQGLL